MKCDPTRIQISDISKTNSNRILFKLKRFILLYSDDSLAKAIRKKLKPLGVYKGIKMVFSDEVTNI